MLNLAIGLGLVGGAAYLGRRGSRLGAAITPGMDDYRFAREAKNRARAVALHLQNARAHIIYARAHDRGHVDIFGKRLPLPSPVFPSRADQCQGALREYHAALAKLPDARSALRHPRMPRMVKDCSRGGSGDYQTCDELRDATGWMDQALHSFKELHREIPAVCHRTVPAVPLSGA